MSLFTNIAKKIFKQTPKIKSVAIDTPSELSQWMYWGSKVEKLRLLVPANLLRLHGCFAYHSGVHPFIEATKKGPQSLAEFYGAHQPKTIAEAHWIKHATPGVGAWELPWIGRDATNPYKGEKGLGPEHGISMFGPCSPEKIKLEFDRLRVLHRAIAEKGYDPDRYGDIQGTFLRQGSDFRFFVRGGKHRAAILALLGYEHIPVTFTRDWPRVIDSSDSASWPLVVQKRLSEQIAREIFDNYFLLDGSQQYTLLGLAPTG